MSSTVERKRRASHAGDWYTADGPTLDGELATWLDSVTLSTPITGCKAIIAPHAGYAYSGPTAAWAYKSIDPVGIKRVFVLGPSHHVYLEGCALSACTTLETPIGNLPVDVSINDELRAREGFETFSQTDDESEHSIEMHLPYVRKIFEDQDITVIPIVVGSVSKSQEQSFGRILAPYLAQPDTICIASSDFCHWGTRFSYTYYYPEPPTSSGTTHGIRLTRSIQPKPDHPIHQSITALDREAMDILTLPTTPPIAAADVHQQFASYLARTKNTICGRHPIGVLLGALSELDSSETTMKWVRYEQSSPCLTIRDSSVSYASAWVRF